MASSLSTGSFHCKGRPGVILGSPKKQQYIPVCATILFWTFLPRYWRCLLHWKCKLGATFLPFLCWRLWYTLLHRVFIWSRPGVIPGSSENQKVLLCRIYCLILLCKQGRPGVIPRSQGQDCWAECYLCALDQYAFELLSPHHLGDAFSLMSNCKDEYVEGRPGVILGSPCFLFSERTGLVFHTCTLFVSYLI